MATENNEKQPIYRFKVPCVWQMMGYLTVDVPENDKDLAWKEAERIAENCNLPANGMYLDESFELDSEGEPMPVPLTKVSCIHYYHQNNHGQKFNHVLMMSGLLTEEQKQEIRDCCLNGKWFVPDLVGLPSVKNPNKIQDVLCELYDFKEQWIPTPENWNSPETIVNRFQKAKYSNRAFRLSPAQPDGNR